MMDSSFLSVPIRADFGAILRTLTRQAPRHARLEVHPRLQDPHPVRATLPPQAGAVQALVALASDGRMQVSQAI
jgi:hypothetical protein